MSESLATPFTAVAAGEKKKKDLSFTGRKADLKYTTFILMMSIKTEERNS